MGSLSPQSIMIVHSTYNIPIVAIKGVIVVVPPIVLFVTCMRAAENAKDAACNCYYCFIKHGAVVFAKTVLVCCDLY